VNPEGLSPIDTVGFFADWVLPAAIDYGAALTGAAIGGPIGLLGGIGAAVAGQMGQRLEGPL